MTGATAERSLADVLRAARERISDPEQWVQGCAGRMADGEPLDEGWEPGAVRWCMAGAVEAEVGHSIRCWPLEDADDFGRLLTEGTGQHGDAIGPWNDNHGHDEVLAAFDRAIELAEAAA